MIPSTKMLDRYDIDLDSPNFREAANNLGIDINDCKKRTLESFATKGITPVIQ